MSILDDFVGGLLQKFFSRTDESSGSPEPPLAEQSAEPVTPKERFVAVAREQWRASEAARASGTRGGSVDRSWGEPAQPIVSGPLFEQPKQEGPFGESLFGSSTPTRDWFERPSDAPSIFGEAPPDERS